MDYMFGHMKLCWFRSGRKIIPQCFTKQC